MTPPKDPKKDHKDQKEGVRESREVREVLVSRAGEASGVDALRKARVPTIGDLLNLVDRVPPQNLDYEQATLGAMLLDEDAADAIRKILVPSDFYRPAHSILFSAMDALRRQKAPVNLLTVSAKLRSKLIARQVCMEADPAQGRHETMYDRVGGGPYLVQLTNALPATTGFANADWYAREVKALSIRRHLIADCIVAIALAYDTERDLTEVYADIRRVLGRVVDAADLLESMGERDPVKFS